MDQLLKSYQMRITAVLNKRLPRQQRSGENLTWKCKGARVHARSYQLAFEIPIGYSCLDVEKQIDALFASCGAIVEVTDRAGVAVISVYPEDFPDVIPYDTSLLQATHGQQILMGMDRQMNPITHDFRVPHLLIAGMSGYGKTDVIRWILFQLIARYTPDELEIKIIDMKGFSFLPFRGIPHITQIARDLAGAYSVLSWGVNTMNQRSREIWEHGDRSRAQRNKWCVVLIDEAAQIAPSLVRVKELREIAEACDSMAAQISCVGREARVGLLYATQRPDATVINPQVKANMEASLCFRTKTQSNSLIVLDRPGAELLPAKKPGRAIYATSEDVQIQVPYVGNDEAWEDLLLPYQKEETDDAGETSEDDGGAWENSVDDDGDAREVLSWEWFPREASVGKSQTIGRGEARGGKAAGDWTK